MANAARLNVNALSFRRSWFSCRMLFQPGVITIQNRETCSFKDSSRSGRQHVTVGDSLRKWKRRFLKPRRTMTCIENETAMYFARSWLTRNDYCRHVCIATLELQHRVEILKDVETLQMSPKISQKHWLQRLFRDWAVLLCNNSTSMKGLSTGFPQKDTSKVGDFSMDVSQPTKTWPEWLEDCHTHIWDPQKPRANPLEIGTWHFCIAKITVWMTWTKVSLRATSLGKSRLSKRTKSRTSFSSET